MNGKIENIENKTDVEKIIIFLLLNKISAIAEKSKNFSSSIEFCLLFIFTYCGLFYFNIMFTLPNNLLHQQVQVCFLFA